MGIDWESKCFDLVPTLNLYSDLEALCWLHDIDRSSWYSIYKGLLTLHHFNPSYLIHDTTTHSNSVIIEAIIAASNEVNKITNLNTN
jgi:hypothetical protein